MMQRTLLTVSLAAAVVPSAIAGETTFSGVPALADAPPRVSGTLTVESGEALTREVEIVFEDKATGETITTYDQELTQELHVLAIDETFSTFVHEHAEEAGSDGRFRLNVSFPKPGLYHIYADATPTGLGQQVLRFDVPVNVPAGTEPDGPRKPEPKAAGAVLEGTDGPYSVRLDASGLRGGVEGEVSLRILKDGKPATDLSPYLGVPAHAVFIGAEDLSYAHAHATAAKMAEGGGDHDSHGAHGSHGAEPAEAAVPAELKLHATPPRPGSYGLWMQFMGGGEVRTVPFTVTVPPSS